MIDSGAKISLQDTEEGQLITIFPQLKSWQKIALRLWIAIWAVTGLLGIMSMLGESSGDQYLYLFVFTILWIYFLYYAIRSVVWHQNGHEMLRIGSENFDYKRSWGSYGKAVSYDLGTIKNLALVNLDGKTFAKTYQDAFWTVGGEKIGFEYLGKKVVIGLRLTDKEAKDVVKRINRGKRKPAK